MLYTYYVLVTGDASIDKPRARDQDYKHVRYQTLLVVRLRSFTRTSLYSSLICSRSCIRPPSIWWPWSRMLLTPLLRMASYKRPGSEYDFSGHSDAQMLFNCNRKINVSFNNYSSIFYNPATIQAPSQVHYEKMCCYRERRHVIPKRGDFDHSHVAMSF